MVSNKLRFQIVFFCRDTKEIANVIAQEFITYTYEKCSDCDDDGQQFFDFVTQGSGMTMLLLLELYSDKVTLSKI